MLPCCTSSQGNRPCNTSPHQPLLHCPSPWPQDNLFRIFGGDRIKGLMSAFRIEDLPIESQVGKAETPNRLLPN